MSTPVDLRAWFGPEAAHLVSRVRIATAEIGDVVHELWPDERAVVHAAVPARVREFARGRSLARELVGSWSGSCAAILRAPNRAPCWPEGFVGSISHAEERCVVAVARASELGAIGIDLEPDRILERELWPEIATPSELAAISALGVTERTRAMLRLFVAKEAVYKCLSTRSGRFLEFHDVEIETRTATSFGVSCPSAARQARACEGHIGTQAGWTLALCTLPIDT